MNNEDQTKTNLRLRSLQEAKDTEHHPRRSPRSLRYQ